MVDIGSQDEYQASQQLQGVPETLTAGIEEIVGEQIKLISTQVDLSEKLSVLIRQVCASDDEVNALCDHVLGLNSGTGSTPEDVFLCLVLYPAALQYAKDPKITCKLKVSFYQQYLNPAIQCAWKFLSKSLFSSYPKCDGSEISQKAGMAVMKMGTMDSRGRINGHMACTYVSPYPSFCDLYLGLYQFANFLLRNYNGRPDNFCMGNNVDQAQEFLRSLQPNSCHQPKANNGHLQLNADECNDNDGGVDQVNQFLADEVDENNEDDNDGNNHTHDYDDSGNDNDDNDKLHGEDDCIQSTKNECKDDEDHLSTKDSDDNNGNQRLQDGSNVNRKLFPSETLSIDPFASPTYQSFLKWSEENGKGMIDNASSFEDFIQLMPNLKLDGDKAAASRTEWNIFVNSPFVMALVHDQLYGQVSYPFFFANNLDISILIKPYQFFV